MKRTALLAIALAAYILTTINLGLGFVNDIEKIYKFGDFCLWLIATGNLAWQLSGDPNQ